MKIAIISDVHANLPALKTVLKHARSQGAKTIWNAGDFVGYGAYPDEVVRLLDKPDVLSIIGNYDRKSLKLKSFSEKKKARMIPEKLFAFQWAYDQLSSSSRKKLLALPGQRRFKERGWKVLITHGSPASETEHLDPSTSDERLRELAAMTKAKIIICGHSHQPFIRLVDETWFINPGSVGRSDDGDPRASYALLRLKKESLEVTFYRLEYDYEKAASRILKFHLPEEFAQMIREGKNLDELKKDSQSNQN